MKPQTECKKRGLQCLKQLIDDNSAQAREWSNCKATSFRRIYILERTVMLGLSYCSGCDYYELSPSLNCFDQANLVALVCLEVLETDPNHEIQRSVFPCLLHSPSNSLLCLVGQPVHFAFWQHQHFGARTS